MSTNKINFRKVRDMGETISATTAFVRQNHKILFKGIAYIALPFILLGLVSYSISIAFFIEELWPEDVSSSFNSYTDIASVLSIFSFLGSIVLIAVIYEYLILYIKRPDFEAITLKDIGQKVLENIGLYLSTTILLFLTFLVALLPMTFIMGIWVFMVGSMVEEIAFLIVFATLGIGLLFTYPIVAVSFIFIVRLVEGKSFAPALSRCFSLIKGNWLSTLWLYLVTVLITISIIGLIPAFLTGSIAMLINLFSWEQAMFLIPITGLVYSLITIIVNVITLIVVALRYFSIVEQKEGIGLMRKIALIGEETAK